MKAYVDNGGIELIPDSKTESDLLGTFAAHGVAIQGVEPKLVSAAGFATTGTEPVLAVTIKAKS